MRGKISSMLFVALTAMVMSWGNAYASPFAYDLKVEGAESASLTFGRFRVDDGVSDAVDQLDCPAPPGVPTRNDDVPEQIPVEGVMNYMYFQGGQGYFNPAASKAVGDAYYRLSVDCKSEATNASTWVLVIADTVRPTVKLSWAPVEGAAAAPAEGTFQLVDAAGAVKVGNMRTTTEFSLAKGTYYIQYRAENAEAAPPTPAPISDVIAAAPRLAKEIILGFNPGKFTASNLQVYYYKGNDQAFPAGTRAAGAEVNGNVLTFTMPDDISSFDAVVINYTLTRSDAGEGAPFAVGAVELKPDDIIEIDLTEVAVGEDPADLGGDPIKVKVDYVDDDKSAYKPITMKYVLLGVADDLTEVNHYAFTGPAWKGSQENYPWTITFDVVNPDPTRAPVDFDVEFIDEGGGVTPFYTADVRSQNGQILTVNLQPALTAKGGKVKFAITASVLDEGGEEIAEEFTAPDVTFQLKGDGNLDVDNSHDGKQVEYLDIVYIYRYRFLNGKDKPLNLLLGTPDQGKLEKATEIRDRIQDMEELLDLDLSDHGADFKFPDINYIYRYRFLNGSTNALNLLLGTPNAGNKEMANAIQKRIKELLLD
ncbi:MAG TPA: hypothetical protein PLE92_04270 [Lentisphaeria bacterium]|nr:hypothetical protein [Lentisphaerota bacterium]HPY89107.1 hypothetical protein [Lentisphaeria bacterium]HQC52324.1 hypothetical protein [Lentisphaeria bacterium]HQL86797.1 hypothetical protein [Lentisphaeria bacterium]